MAESSDRTYIIFNNHYKGQAPTNARTFEKMLRGLIGDRLHTVDTGESPRRGDRLFD